MKKHFFRLAATILLVGLASCLDNQTAKASQTEDKDGSKVATKPPLTIIRHESKPVPINFSEVIEQTVPCDLGVFVIRHKNIYQNDNNSAEILSITKDGLPLFTDGMPDLISRVFSELDDVEIMPFCIGRELRLNINANQLNRPYNAKRSYIAVIIEGTQVRTHDKQNFEFETD